MTHLRFPQIFLKRDFNFPRNLIYNFPSKTTDKVGTYFYDGCLEKKKARINSSRSKIGVIVIRYFFVKIINFEKFSETRWKLSNFWLYKLQIWQGLNEK